jgi:hypothetical protein
MMMKKVTVTSVLLAALLCGCGGDDASVAASEAPAAQTNVWQDIAGVYTAKRIKTGYKTNHKAFFDEIELHPAATVQISQDSNRTVTVLYDTLYAKTVTNQIEAGSATADWRWLNGNLIYSSHWSGNNPGYMMPGGVTQHRTCTVRKNQDGSVTVKSLHQGSGKALWLIKWKDPADESEIQLIPKKTES